MMAAGLVLLLVASFGIGAIINRDDAPTNAPEPVLDQAAEDSGIPRTRRADVTLVPIDDASPFEQPITSAPLTNPAEGVPTEYQRRDATAVSSVEYAALAKRAQDEQRADQQMVDPRSITGPAYAQAPRREPPQTASTPSPVPSPQPIPAPMTSASVEPERRRDPTPPRRTEREDEPEPRREPARVVERTRAVPEHQPVPRLNVSQPVTARLTLTIGADGRVKGVRIRNSVPGQTPELIAAVQRWRFKPATENGVPVTSQFNVDISFNP